MPIRSQRELWGGELPPRLWGALALLVVVACAPGDAGQPAGPAAEPATFGQRAGSAPLPTQDASATPEPPATVWTESPSGCTSFTFSHHPDGYAAPEVHGPDAKLRVQDCRVCHGYDLAGCIGAPSCDGCHTPGWRQTCTFCHGGTLDDSGAPPRYLDPEYDGQRPRFESHTAHVEDRNHAGFACVQCHVQPRDVLSDGHLFDDTHGTAEAVFVAGLSPQAQYDPERGCSAVYCHGDGRSAADAALGNEPLRCDGCHGDMQSVERLSPSHAAHLRPVTPSQPPVDRCELCHVQRLQTTADGIRLVAGRDEHVNGKVDLILPDTIAVEQPPAEAPRCNGECHGVVHGGPTANPASDRQAWRR